MFSKNIHPPLCSLKLTVSKAIVDLSSKGLNLKLMKSTVTSASKPIPCDAVDELICWKVEFANRKDRKSVV